MESWDFDPDEGFFLLGAAVAGVMGTWRWYIALEACWPVTRAVWKRLSITGAAVAGLIGLFFVLTRWADPKTVVGHPDYITLFFVGGAGWACASLELFRWLGVDARDDAVERDNGAAAIAASGGVLGMMVVYTFSNIGSGPTIWTTIVPAVIGSGVLAVLWAILGVVTQAAEAIAIERDMAAGWRMGGFTVAAGLVLGRAMAGDFSSWEATMRDFARLGWPALILTAAVGIMNGLWWASVECPRPPVFRRGFLPAGGMCIAALVYVWALGAIH